MSALGGTDPTTPEAAAPVDPANPAAAPTAPGWWRRNRWGLLGFVIILPVSIAAVFADSWGSYYEVRASRPVVAGAEHRVQMPTAAFETIASARLPADTPGARDMPDGTELVLALLEVAPASGGIQCQITLAAADGVGEWQPLNAGEYGWSPEEGAVYGACDSERTGPYSVDLAFLVPEGADAELDLVVESFDWLPEFLRARLPAPQG